MNTIIRERLNYNRRSFSEKDSIDFYIEKINEEVRKSEMKFRFTRGGPDFKLIKQNYINAKKTSIDIANKRLGNYPVLLNIELKAWNTDFDNKIKMCDEIISN